MSETAGFVISALVGLNSVLLVVVGWFLAGLITRLIKSLSDVAKKQQDIEVKHVEMQGKITAIADRLIDLVKMIGIPERVSRLEDDIKNHEKCISRLRERSHDLANHVNNLVMYAQLEGWRGFDKSQEVHFKNWKDE